jgi:hypothetical protein
MLVTGAQARYIRGVLAELGPLEVHVASLPTRRTCVVRDGQGRIDGFLLEYRP